MKKHILKAATMAVAMGLLPGLALAGQAFYDGVLDSSSPTFDNPGGSSSGTALQYYHVQEFSVDASGNYTIEAASPNTAGTPSNALDTYLNLYSGAFNPASPSAGLVTGNDDFTGALTVLPGPYAGTITATATGFQNAQPSSRIANVPLTAGTTYFLVTSSFRSTDYTVTAAEGAPVGPHYNGIDGPGNITLTGALLPPDISVSVASLSASQAPDATTTQSFSIANDGEADLNWTIGEAAPAPAGVGSTPNRLVAAAPENLDKLILDAVNALGPVPEGGTIVSDGGFELGLSGPWTEESTTYGTVLCTVGDCGTGGGTGPHSGSWWAWFGGAAAGDTGYAEQSVVIPTEDVVQLSFYLQIPPITTITGYVRVLIDGNVLASYGQADAAAYATYQQVVLDIGAYADGGSHTLRFESVTTGSGNYFIDDVAITAEGAPVGCAAPEDIGWLSASPAAGTTAGGTSSEVTVTFDSTGLVEGTYDALLCIDSNDPDPAPGNGTRRVEIPVQLVVEGGGTGGPGTVELAPPRAVPANDAWALALLAGVLGLFGVAVARRRG